METPIWLRDTVTALAAAQSHQDSATALFAWFNWRLRPSLAKHQSALPAAYETAEVAASSMSLAVSFG